jgi:hypothetical protein
MLKFFQHPWDQRRGEHALRGKRAMDAETSSA